jgi:Tripartite tricarboxylate transporter TctB family
VKRFLGTRITDYMPALGLLGITAAYLATAYNYNADARAVPAGVAWVMLVLVVLDLLSRTQTRIGIALMHWLNPAGDAANQKDVKRYPVLKQIAAVAWIAAFAAALVLIGIIYAVPLYVFSSLFFQGRRPLPLCIGVSVAATAMIYVLFAVVLRLELYPGILFGGA